LRRMRALGRGFCKKRGGGFAFSPSRACACVSVAGVPLLLSVFFCASVLRSATCCLSLSLFRCYGSSTSPSRTGSRGTPNKRGNRVHIHIRLSRRREVLSCNHTASPRDKGVCALTSTSPVRPLSLSSLRPPACHARIPCRLLAIFARVARPAAPHPPQPLHAGCRGGSLDGAWPGGTRCHGPLHAPGRPLPVGARAARLEERAKARNQRDGEDTEGEEEREEGEKCQQKWQ